MGAFNWCANLSNDEKRDFQNWVQKTGKEDLMSVKHYLGRKFYPQFYKEILKQNRENTKSNMQLAENLNAKGGEKNIT